jgi:hypothetical protein
MENEIRDMIIAMLFLLEYDHQEGELGLDDRP